MKKASILIAVTLSAVLHLQAQNSDSLLQLPSAYLDNITYKASQLEQRLDNKSKKALQQLLKQENKIKRKLGRIDSLKAKEIFSHTEQQYQNILRKAKNAGNNKQYIPSLDTLVTSLKFLQQNPQFISSVNAGDEKLKHALTKVTRLEDEFQKAEEIKKFIQERKQFLRDQLSNLEFTKELKKISKTGYYHAQYISEIKELIKDKRRAGRKVLELLGKTSLFQKFFRKNSHLASLFRMPGELDDPVSLVNLAGLQTRASVNALIQSQLSSGGPNAQQQLQQNIAQAQSALNKLKDKISQVGGNGTADEMPNFKINNQRKKNFWKKWELGVTTQSNKPNSLFPVTTDVTMQAGFRPHDNYVVGVGIGGLIGWGRDIRHIDISSQGMSIKSFAEIKIRGSFHFAAGYEMNYRSEIRNIEQLKDRSMWQYSGLAGLSKVVSVKSKFFKKARVQILWDALAYRSVPRQPAIVFRIGYSFK